MRIVLAVGLALCSISCASGTSSTDDQFMKTINDEGISIDGSRAREIAHDVCDSFRNHPEAHKSDVVLALATKQNWTPKQAGVFTGAAIGAYCMEFHTRTWE